MYGIMGKVKTQHTLDHPGDGDLTQRMKAHIDDILAREDEIRSDPGTRRYAPGGKREAPPEAGNADGEAESS